MNVIWNSTAAADSSGMSKVPNRETYSMHDKYLCECPSCILYVFHIHRAVSKIMNPSKPHATLCCVHNKEINRACHRVDMWLGIFSSLATMQQNEDTASNKTLTITGQDIFPGHLNDIRHKENIPS